MWTKPLVSRISGQILNFTAFKVFKYRIRASFTPCICSQIYANCITMIALLDAKKCKIKAEYVWPNTCETKQHQAQQKEASSCMEDFAESCIGRIYWINRKWGDIGTPFLFGCFHINISLILNWWVINIYVWS